MEYAGTGPVTLLHGDARHDNLMYPDDGSPPHIVDWQFVANGRAMVDIAYYLCPGGDATLVAPMERDVIGAYPDALMRAGAADCTPRSEELRVGTGRVRTCKFRGGPGP